MKTRCQRPPQGGDDGETENSEPESPFWTEKNSPRRGGPVGPRGSSPRRRGRSWNGPKNMAGQKKFLRKKKMQSHGMAGGDIRAGKERNRIFLHLRHSRAATPDQIFTVRGGVFGHPRLPCGGAPPADGASRPPGFEGGGGNDPLR